jgi:hypothetical protein
MERGPALNHERSQHDAGIIVATADDSASKTFGHTLLLTPVRR